MHIVALAWMFVVVLMALAEATSSQGTVLGALITFVLYGVLPLSIVLYLLGTPMRRRAIRQREAEDAAARAMSSRPQADGSGHATGPPVSPERKEG